VYIIFDDFFLTNFFHSIDSTDPRLTDRNEKYKPKDGNSGELTKPPFGFEKDNSGNALVDVKRLSGNSHPKAKAPPTEKSVPRDQGPPKNESLSNVQGPPPKDKCPTKPPAPNVTKAIPPPAALTPHVHKAIGCEVCSKNEDDRRKQTSNVSLRKFISKFTMHVTDLNLYSCQSF
jgi:hypothetical protein